MATFLFRFLSRSSALVLACAAIQSASAFSVFGPPEAWQTATLDYVDRYYYPAPGVFDFEPGAPKNFGQGSRLNSPIVTYGYDITFLDYFGAKGVAAIDSAMALLNNLPAASAANLSSFIMQGNQQINYSAQALQLTDLKSLVMSLMLEHMGLIGESHVWDLLSRNPLTLPQPCQFDYAVINRNFDPKTFLPSSYVNGVNYTYQIWDGCPIAQSVADAIEFPVDGASAAELTYTAVATRYALEPGGYYLGLTYDDMGGLRYLYNKNNFAYESLDPTAAVSSFSTSPWEGVTLTNATGITGGIGIGVTAGVSNFVGFLGGVEKITYVKLPSDSILGGGFTPRTFSYTIPWLTNGSIQALRVTRTVTTPDIVFSAGNLTSNNLQFPFNYAAYSRGFNFIATGAAVVGNGVLPEVISPQETITFNNVTPITFNQTPSFLDGQTEIGFPILLWGTFNGTTNAPTVYPSTSSLDSLIAELFNGSTVGGQSITWYGLTGPTNAATSGSGGSQ